MSKYIKIKKLNVFQTGLIFCATYFIISMVFLLPLSLFGIIAGNPVSLLLILLSFVYGFIGFIFGCIFSYVYNIVSNKLGGIEIEYESIEKFSN
jgi:hypothetical protein